MIRIILLSLVILAALAGAQTAMTAGYVLKGRTAEAVAQY